MLTITYPDKQEQKLFFDDLLRQSIYTILYFYPKDDTPGCTREALDFSQKQENFQSKGVQVIGVSQDSHKSHCSFNEKYGLSVPLISDPDHELHNNPRFTVWGEKTMYGKKYMGTVRSTFLINSQGEVLKGWRNVSVVNHVEKVWEYVNENFS